MQDRYVGDVGDFVKYALLRAVALGRTVVIRAAAVTHTVSVHAAS